MPAEFSIAEELVAEKARGRQREQLLEGENEALRLIVERAPLQTILTQLTRVAEQHGSAGLLTSILLMDDDGMHLRHGAAPSLPDSYNRAIDGIAIGPSVGSCGTAAYRREPVIVSDIGTDPLWAEFKELAELHGLRACWSTPVMSSRGHVLGTFALYYRTASRPAAEDKQVVDILTRTCALAIENKRAERSLAESEERFRCLSRCSPIGIFTSDTEGAFTYVNPKFQEWTGYAYEKTVDFWLESSPNGQRAAQHWRQCAARSEEFEAEITVAEVTMIVRAAPMTAAGGTHIGHVGTVERIFSRPATAI